MIRAQLLSFLVPVWEGASHIDRFVECYRALGYPNHELVLCAGGGDGSYAIAARHAGPDIIVLEQRAGEGKQQALRRCYEQSRGQLLFLTDIDCRPTGVVVNNLVRHLLGPARTIEAVTGPSCPLPEQMGSAFVATQWAVERAAEPDHLSAAHGLLGRNAVLTRAAAEAAGGFRFAARSGTDYALAQELRRAGITVRYVAGASMPTEFPGTPGEYIHKQARWIRNVFLLGRRYGVWRDVRAAGLTIALSPALVGGAVLSAPRRAGHGPSRGSVRAALAAIVACALLNRLGLQMMTGARPSLRAAAVHFGATQMAALCAARDLVLRRETW